MITRNHCVLGCVATLTLLAPAARASPTLTAAMTDDERRAYELYEDEQMVSARTRAAAILRKNDRSMAAHFVMGAVLHEAEGSLPRALYHLGEARKIYESRYRPSLRAARGVGASPPGGATPWPLHRETLYRAQRVAREMELFDYQLDVLNYHDYLYDPDLLAERAWPLMRLGEFKKARRFAKQAIDRRVDPWQVSAGKNALCAIEGRAGYRHDYHTACEGALSNAQGRAKGDDQAPLAVHAHNAALASLSVFDAQRAEKLLSEATQRLEFTTANPWRLLAQVHLSQGRMTEAVADLREMQRWRARQPAYLREQDHAETQSALALVMWVAGKGEWGLRFVQRAMDRPDRRGFTSVAPEQSTGAHALLRRALRRLALERRAERAAARGTWARWMERFRSIPDRIAQRADAERVRRALADASMLLRTVRVAVRGGLEPAPLWLLGDLTDVLGTGVVLEALRRARAEERHEPEAIAQRARLRRDVLWVETRFRAGDHRRALHRAQALLGELPTDRVLTTARLRALAFSCALRLKKRRLAATLAEMALRQDPGVFRRLGLSLPVRVQHGGGRARELADRLLDSPRFHRGSLLRLRTRFGTRPSVCLLNHKGDPIHCTEATIAQMRKKHGRTFDAVPLLLDRFFDEAFGGPLNIAAYDLRSLDGRTVTGRAVTREHLEHMLEQLPPEPPK